MMVGLPGSTTMHANHRFGTASLVDPCFTISEEGPWLEEEKQSCSTNSFDTFELGTPEIVHREQVATEDVGLQKSIAIVPERRGKRAATGPSLGNKLLLAFTYAVDSAVSSTGHRRRPRAASLPAIHVRPTVSDPRLERSPTPLYAWGALGEQSSRASASTASQGPGQQLPDAWACLASSSKMDSTHAAYDWTNGW